MGNIYLAADSGGSKTVFLLVDEKGTVLTEVKTEGMGAVRAGVLPIRDIIKTAKEKIDIFGKPKAIFLSLGGPNTKEVYDELIIAHMKFFYNENSIFYDIHFGFYALT